LDEDRHGDGLVLIQPECHGRRCIDGLEDSDVAGSRPEREAQVDGKQRDNGADHRDREMRSLRGHVVGSDL
jgi:hypothetical protein